MSVASSVVRLLPSLDGPTNLVRVAWDRLHALPGGRRIFSALIGRSAPYTATIGAEVVELEVGRAVVVMRDRRAVRNHIRCVHAVALANLVELTGNLAIAYSMPDEARFIVAGMNLEYLKKARGTLRAVSECPVPEDSTRREYQVPVSIYDAAGVEVTRATLRTLIGPKPRA